MAHRSCINLVEDDKKHLERGLDGMGDNNKSCRDYVNGPDLSFVQRSTLLVINRFLFVLGQAPVFGTRSLPATLTLPVLSM